MSIAGLNRTATGMDFIKRTTRLALGLSILTSPVFAQGIPLHPPSQFAGPYHGELTEIVLPISEVHQLCSKLTYPRKKLIRGCAVHSDDFSRCLIVYPKRAVGGIQPQDIRRHETAHCNKWQH